MQKYLLFPGTPEQLWKGRFEGTGEWRPFNEIENWMSLSVDTQEKVIQFDRKENSLVMIKEALKKFREIKHLQLSISFSPFQIKQVSWNTGLFGLERNKSATEQIGVTVEKKAWLEARP